MSDSETLSPSSTRKDRSQSECLRSEEQDLYFSLLKAEPKEGSLWYVISKSWLSSWEHYLCFGSPVPGPISSTDLVLHPVDILLDPRPQKVYNNIVLKSDISEKVHYEVIPKSAYLFLKEKYLSDGKEIKRWCISLMEDGSGLHVEIRLKGLKVLVLPYKGQDTFTVMMSRIETINSLKDKLVAIWPDLAKLQFRAWICSDIEVSELKSASKFAISGKLLPVKTMIEDCEIAENSLVIAEFKYKDQWVIFRADEICAHCKNSGSLKQCSVCKSVKYCSRSCQVSDFKSHKEVCKAIQNKEIGSGLVGFHNLGFTCFMNSALQCLIHSPLIKQYFLSKLYLQHINTKNPLGTTNAALVKVFAEIMKDVWLGDEKVLAPWALKKVISKFAPQFIGYDQHDSHELLTFLLSGLHEDLNQVLDKPYVEKPEADGLDDAQASSNSWKWFLLRNKSWVTDHMYGQVKSSLKCPSCGKQSFTFDPFLTLSVNIPNTKRSSFEVLLVSNKQEVTNQSFLLYSNTTVSKIRALLMKKYSMKNLILLYYNDQKPQGLCDENIEITEYSKKKIIAFECPEDLKTSSFVLMNIIEPSKSLPFYRVMFFKKTDTFKKLHKILKSRLPPLYKIFIKNSAGYTGFFSKTRKPCVFCKDPNCSNCPLPKSNMTLSEAAELVGDDSQVQLEIHYEDPSHCQSIITVKETDSIVDSFVPDEPLTLNTCLDYTMKSETLDSENEWFCSGCKTHVQAQKSVRLYLLPSILIIHLVRFRARGILSQKNTEFIEFPVSDLDMSSCLLGPNKGKYDLYAVCNHFGGVGGGHYTATVKTPEGWYNMDDASVSQMSTDKVVSSSAYILFYKLKNLDA